MRRFPPRLPAQPIFYPVLNRAYAVEIASGWNVRDAPHAGYVLRFEIPDDYGARFDAHVVGASMHQELWIPADQLDAFNRQLVGEIVVEEAFFGTGFTGEVPEHFALRGKDAIAQIQTLSALVPSIMDFSMEVSANRRVVFLHYPFWSAAGATRLQIDSVDLRRCLAALRSTWTNLHRPAPLIERATAC